VADPAKPNRTHPTPIVESGTTTSLRETRYNLGHTPASAAVFRDGENLSPEREWAALAVGAAGGDSLRQWFRSLPELPATGVPKPARIRHGLTRSLPYLFNRIGSTANFSGIQRHSHHGINSQRIEAVDFLLFGDTAGDHQVSGSGALDGMNRLHRNSAH